MNEIKKGIVLSYIMQIVTILGNLLYTPIMLRLLGTSEFGLLQLINSVISNLNLLNLGFTASYMRFFSKEKVNNGEDGVARLNGMFIEIFSFMSFICLICGLIIIYKAGLIFGNKLTLEEIDKAKILISIILINYVINFPNSVFNCIIFANEKFSFQKLFSLCIYIISIICNILILVLGFGSLGLVMVSAIFSVISFVVNAVFCLKVLNTKFTFNHFNFGLFREMFIFNFFIFLNQIVDQVNWGIDKFLLGRILGTTAVAIYGIASIINNLYIHLSTNISSFFTPKINMIIANKENNDKILNLFIKIGRIQFIVLFLILSGFIVFGKAFIIFWAGQSYAEAYYVVLFLIIPSTISLIQNLGIEIQRARNKHQARSIVYIIISIFNIIISIPLIKKFGVAGASMGTAFALLLGNCLFMNWYYYKYLDLNVIKFWKNVISFFPALIMPTLVGILIIRFVYIKNIFVMILGILFYVIIYTFSMYLFGLNEYEKNLVRGFIKKIK